jgi:hypothetical protein
VILIRDDTIDLRDFLQFLRENPYPKQWQRTPEETDRAYQNNIRWADKIALALSSKTTGVKGQTGLDLWM